jgi:hypothetical protein
MKFHRSLVTLMGALLALSLCVPARAELVLHPSAQDHAKQWTRLWLKLPERFRALDVHVREYDGDIEGYGSSLLGAYWEGSPGRIAVSGRGQTNHVMAHELGHHIHVQLTAAEAAIWIAAYQDAKEAGTLPSEYAHTNPWEGFAECWEHYARDKRFNKKLKAALLRVTGIAS